MIFLRVLSFLGGSFVLFAGPFLLLSAAAGPASLSTIILFMGTVAVVLFALGYYFVALAGRRAARSQTIRSLAAALLVFQLAAGAWLLSASHNARVLLAVAPLLCLSVFLFMAFIWPGDGGRSHRPMRRRDHSPMH